MAVSILTLDAPSDACKTQQVNSLTAIILMAQVRQEVIQKAQARKIIHAGPIREPLSSGV